MSNEEHGIAQTQIAAAKEDRLQNYHSQTIHQQNERILAFVFALLFIALILIWMTASSVWLLAGSGLLAVAALILWGGFRIKRIQAVRKSREQDVEESEGRLLR